MNKPLGKKKTNKGTLLIVDDDLHVLHSMADWLGEQGYQVSTASGYEEAVRAVDNKNFNLVLADIRLSGNDGFDLLAYCQKQHAEMPVVLMTGYGSVEMAVEAVRGGAFDFLTKPIIDQELEMAIERAINQREVIEENNHLKAQLDIRYGMENIVGHDHRMLRVYDMVESIADTKATVLITGESGTGKSLIARAIHRQSARRDKPFVEVACGSLPETLLESELFGHVAGAFTGALGDKIGKFEQADGGSIFLDEIGTASPNMQVKLLRVLQDFEFEKVGSTITSHPDTRVILAANEDLAMLVEQGTFRQDLFYRINVINIELPPLRDRMTDIPRLAQHFLEQICEESGKRVKGFTDEVMEVLQCFRWPGNVRELQNAVERAVLLGKGDMVRLEDLPKSLPVAGPISVEPIGRRTLKEALEGPERQFIFEVLESNSWNRNLTAETLGINRTTLYKKMKRLGLEDACRPRLVQV